MDNPSATGDSGVGVLDKAVAVLDAVTARPRSLRELVAETGISRPTAHRIAVALERHRLLDRLPDGRFTPGSRLRTLAGAAAGDPLVAAAGPVLDRLRDASGESAQLYRRRGAERVCIAAAERSAGLRDTVPVGAVLPMTAGSAAQVLIAWAPAADTAALLRHARFSARTLAAVRRRGWAASVAERESGVASVSAPVRDESGSVVAALSVSGPIDRLGRAPGRAHHARVVAAAVELSRTLAAGSVAVRDGQPAHVAGQ